MRQNGTRSRQRNRPAYAFGAVVVIALGLLSRREMRHLPSPIGKDLGDVLYALMAFLIVATLLSQSSMAKVGVTALLFCVLVEISKLWLLPTLMAFRSTTAGHLLLGYGFSWSNLVCYVIGVSIGGIMEWGHSLALRPREVRK